ncbi:MAG: hypothetical protein ACYDAD_13785, partial [Acidimicrobiales bacterium]
MYCRAPADTVQHHTGKCNGAYLDPGLTGPACLRCNIADFHAWRLANLHDIADPSLARMLRLAFEAARLEACGRKVMVLPAKAAAHCFAAVAHDLAGRR